jgi:hypothetical protein
VISEFSIGVAGDVTVASVERGHKLKQNVGYMLKMTIKLFVVLLRPHANQRTQIIKLLVTRRGIILQADRFLQKLDVQAVDGSPQGRNISGDQTRIGLFTTVIRRRREMHPLSQRALTHGAISMRMK